MTTTREIMTPEADWIDLSATVADAARRMGNSDYGALPVCDGEGHLQGVVTDRDIVVRVVATGDDPDSVQISDLLEGGEVITIGADDDVEEAIRTMKVHGVRRLPVIDGAELVGMVSQADIARALPDARVGDLVGSISDAPPNN